MPARTGLGPRLRLAALSGAVAVALGLGGAEAYLRARHHTYHPDNLRPSPLAVAGHADAACYAPHPVLGWAPLPGTCGREAHGTVQTPALAGAPPAGVPRVVVLGDSIADQRVWVAEATAAAARARGGPLVTYNAGVPGYDTCSEVTLLEERLLSLRPDRVLLQFCLNDFEVSAAVLPAGPGWVRVQGPQPVELPAAVLRSRLALDLALRFGWGRPAAIAHRPQLGVGPCLDRLAALGAAHGFDVRVVLFPALSDAPAEGTVEIAGQPQPWDAAEAAAEALFAARGFPVLALRGPLAARGPLVAQRDQPLDVWHPDRPAQLAIGPLVGPFLADGLAPRP